MKLFVALVIVMGSISLAGCGEPTTSSSVSVDTVTEEELREQREARDQAKLEDEERKALIEEKMNETAQSPQVDLNTLPDIPRPEVTDEGEDDEEEGIENLDEVPNERADGAMRY